MKASDDPTGLEADSSAEAAKDEVWAIVSKDNNPNKFFVTANKSIEENFTEIYKYKVRLEVETVFHLRPRSTVSQLAVRRCRDCMSADPPTLSHKTQ